VNSGLVDRGSVLLIESLDRLTRMEPFEAQFLFSSIIRAGVAIVTLADGQRYDAERLNRDPTAFMLAYMVAMRAHEESATKGRRVRAAWEEKRRKVRSGEATRLTRRAPAWLRPDGEGWAVDEERAAVVRRVYALTLVGHGEHRIAEALNREGVPPLGKAKHWHRSSVAKLLRNSAVIGTLTPGRIERVNGQKRRVAEEPIAGAFPAIIDEADWLAIRSLKDGHAAANRGRGAGAPLANVLAGLARCPIDGAAMTRVTKGSRSKAGRPKLVCTRAKVGVAKHYHAVPLDAVQDAIFAKPAWLVESIPAGNRGEQLDAEVRRIQGTVAGTEEHLRDLMEEADARPSQAIASRIAKVGAELDTLRAQLEAFEEQRRVVDGGLVHERAVRLTQALRDYNGGPVDAINAAMRVLFEGVVVDHRTGQLHFHWRQGGVSTLPYAFSFTPED
jgi:hypothetical protein